MSGKARKERHGLWQRMKSWFGDGGADEELSNAEYRQPGHSQLNPQDLDLQPPASAAGGPSPAQVTVALRLPDGQQLALIATSVHERGPGCLQLDVAAPPANTMDVVDGLIAIATGDAPVNANRPQEMQGAPLPPNPDLLPSVPMAPPRSVPSSSSKISLPPVQPMGSTNPSLLGASSPPGGRTCPSTARGGIAGVMGADGHVESVDLPPLVFGSEGSNLGDANLGGAGPGEYDLPPSAAVIRSGSMQAAASASGSVDSELGLAGTRPSSSHETNIRDTTATPAADLPAVVIHQAPPSDEPPENASIAEASRRPRPRGLRSSQMPIVGIDFGTSYSTIGVMRAGLEIIPDERGDPLLPSVISFPAPGDRLIGWEARNRMGGEAQFTIVSPKRLLGRLYKDNQVAQLIGGLAFRTFAGTDKFVRFEAHGEIYSVTDVCAMILGRLRERACRYLNAEVSKSVFAVPVSFGTLQRSALEVAARQAGLEPVGLITEPSAAVLAHGFRGRRGRVAVYDFGGGTFDFSVLEVTASKYQVLCSGGDPWLGGDDFDNVIASHMADRFWKETGVDLRSRAVEWQALLFACEGAKRTLSNRSSAEVKVDNLLHTASGPKGLRYKLSRKEFVKLAAPLIEKSVEVSRQVMKQAGIGRDQVDGLVVTGGTSMIPAVRNAVTQLFQRKPVDGDPDLAVVRGAALRAAELSGDSASLTSTGGRKLREVAGRTIGAGPKGGRVVTLFERDTPIPAEISRSFHTLHDNQTDMVIGLYEESKSRVDRSRTIGHLRYKGLRTAPKGEARIDFTFVLDANGILHVRAIVEGKAYEKSIRLG